MASVYGIEAGVVAAALSFAVCAFFRVMQLGIVRSRPSKLRAIGRAHHRQWRYARLIRSQSGKYLFVCHTGFFFGALWLGLALAAMAYQSLPTEIISDNGPLNLLSLSVLVLAAASIPLFALQLCRAVAFNYPERMLLFFGSSFVLFSIVLSPIVFIVDTALEALVTMFGLEYPCERQISSPADDLREIVEESGEPGEMEEGEKEMIKGVILLGDTTVREIMTPRVDVTYINFDATLPELRKKFLDEKLSRILICGESLDDVRGVVHSKDLLQFVGNDGHEFSLQKVMRPACMVPGAKKIDDVLEEFREQAIHFAVVLDEHGGVDGVVTVEDLLEEIVGEIFDEFDSPADEVEVKKTKSGDFLIDGSLSVADFNQRFRAHLPEGEYDTIAGFLIHEISRMPERGEVVDCGRFRIRIEEIEENRITVLRVLKRRKPLHISKHENSESDPGYPESKIFEVQRQTRANTR